MKIEYENKIPIYFLTPMERGADTLKALFVVWFFVVFISGMAFANIRGQYAKLPLSLAIIFIGGFILIWIIYRIGLLQWGYEVHLTKNIFRKYRGNSTFRWGKWKPIPEYDYFLISKNLNRNINPALNRGLEINEYGEKYFYYDLTLITKGDADVLIYSSPYRDYLISLVRDLRNKMPLKLFEQTISGEVEINMQLADRHNIKSP